MRVTITVEREYEMDEAKVIAEFGSVMAETGQPLDAFLRESFFELCGFERDVDHIDGSYVRLLDEYDESHFEAVAEQTKETA